MYSTKMTAFFASSAAQPKIEKKIIDEKIAKVREVVKNISTNDIVLALHNFDLDVARTIHAFCEGGSEIALGDWEKTGGAKKRNNKKKAKPAPPNNGHSNSNLTKGTFGASSVSSISSATYSNGFSSNFNSNNQHQPNLLNGVQIPTPLEQPPITTFSTAANNKQQSNAISPTSTINEHSVMNGSDNTPLNSNKTTSNVLGTNLDAHLGKTSIGSKNVFANPISVAPSDNQSHLEHNKSLFENEIIYAQENIQRCFKEFRDAIVLREKQIMAELVECRSAGLAYFIARTDTVEKMNDKSTSNQKYIAAELEKFNSAKTEDLETALTTRFLYDNSAFTSLISTIGQFGSVIPVKMIAPPLVSAKKEVANPPLGQQQVRRSNSPSSLVSSLDSGLGGQISPVNQEKAAVAKVDEGGIVLKSDCISAEMLAEIQRNILDSLKAKGIDPSVLADINSSTMTAPRRRQPPPSTNKAPSGGGEQQKAGGGGGQQQRGRANGNKGGGQGTGNNKKPGHQGNKTNAAK